MVDRYRGKKGGFGSLSEKNYYEMKKRAEERANKKKKKNAQFTKLQESDAAGVKRDEAAAKRRKDAANTNKNKNTNTVTALKDSKTSNNRNPRGLSRDNESDSRRIGREKREAAEIKRKEKIKTETDRYNAVQEKVKGKIKAGNKNFTLGEKDTQAYRDANKTKTGLSRFFSKISGYGRRQSEARKRKYEEAVAARKAETDGKGAFNKGGMVKKAAYKKGGAVKMKNGGVVKKTRSTTKRKSIDGIALRGKTRAARSR